MSDQNKSLNQLDDGAVPEFVVTPVLEETLIDNMTSFLEANGASKVDKGVLRNMAKSLSLRVKDTSPGTLLDVKMDNPYGVGYHSPCGALQTYQGSTSPAVQGRSVREFEEQMTNIRKENFNLKLRLYFIEESIPGYHQSSNSSDGQESLMKQLIDCKVEMEVLRKELNEKQSLLQDAARAINHMENVSKETEIKHQEELNDLKQKLEYFENKYEVEKNHNINEDLLGRSDVAENLNALQRIRELEELLRHSDEKLLDFQNQITSLDDILAKRDETIRECEDKLRELAFQNNELLEAAESKDKDAASIEHSKRGLRSANAQLKAENGKLLKALKMSQQNCTNEITCMKAYEKKMREQQDVIMQMQVEQQHKDEIQKYKCELADKTCVIMELEEKLNHRDNLYEKACSAIQNLMVNMKSLKTELSELKGLNASSSNNSKSSNQQETTNCGWEYTNLCRLLSDTALGDLNASQKEILEQVIEQQEITIKNLQCEVKKKTADLQNLVNKELWEKNREIERLNKMFNNKTVNMNNESSGEVHQPSISEFSKAVQRNKLLQRKVDILTQRLDGERNSDNVISQLRNDLKKAREDAEAADKWRKEFCTILSTRLEELAGFLNSLLKHKDVLGFLAADKRKAMRRAVDRSLDLSKSFNMTLSVSGLSMADQSLVELTNLSGLLDAFEAGMDNDTFNSHEDFNVTNLHSMEKLKAENKVLQRELEKRRIAENKKERRSLPLGVMVENRESESEAWSEPDRKVSMARIGLEDHSGSLLATKEQPTMQQSESESDCKATVAQLDSRLAKSRSHERIMHLEQAIQQREKHIVDIQRQLHEAENRTKVEILNALKLTAEIEEMKVRNKELHDDLVAIGSVQDASHNGNESLLLQQIAEKNQSLEKVEEERDRLLVESRLAEMQINTLKSEMEQIKENYESALARAIDNEKEQLSLYEGCKQQLSDLQKQLIENQRTIECLQENEHELKQALVESEISARNMQKQIDESTLNASRATTERVKALNDKFQLEKRLQELTQQLTRYQADRSQLQQHIKNLEDEQKVLTDRLAEAEAATKEAKQSGYTSEEVPMVSMESSVKAVNIVPPLIMGEQRLNNSSPDLGIESDAGRVSSVELSNLQRPSLRTLEITTDCEGNTIAEVNTNDKNSTASSAFKKHDCAKVDQELIELRHKLVRTHRAFEETYRKLRNSNLRKAQVERDIKNQILKTHNLLQNVRSNMENEVAPKTEPNH